MKSPTPPIPLTGTIIGAPKIEDFKPLAPHELGNIAGPVQQVLNQGMDPNQPAAIPTIVLCRLLTTVNCSFQEWSAMSLLTNEICWSLSADEDLSSAFIAKQPDLWKKIQAHLDMLEAQEPKS